MYLNKWVNPFQLFYAPEGAASGADGNQEGNSGTPDTTKNVSLKEYDKFLDDSSVEDIDKTLAAIKGGSLVPEDIKKSGDDDPNKANLENGVNNPPPPPDPQKKTIDDNAIHVITDEYINNAPEADREILRGIKGEKLSNKAYQNYMNAERWILERKTGKTADEPPAAQTEVVLDETKLTDELKTQRDAYVFKSLKAKYPELPEEALTDHLVLEEFAEGLSKLQFSEFERLLKTAQNEANTTVSQYVDLRTNWETYALQNITKDVQKFIGELKEYGITEKDLGLDLSIAKDKKNPYLLGLLFSNGQPNNKAVRFVHGDIPVVLPDGVYNVLLETNMKKIIDTVKSKSHNAGYLAKVGDDPDPSLANSSISGSNQRKENLDETNLKSMTITDDDTLEQIDQKLAKIKNKVINQAM